MKVGVVEQLWRYPVKSMGGETVAESMLSSAGVAGDRVWAVRDEVRGGIRGAKQLAGLMKLAARQAADGTVEIVLEDGSTFAAAASDVNDRLSTALDHAVTLWPLLPAEALDHYRRGAPDNEDLEQELRGIFGRTADEPLPDLSLFPPEILEFESPPGTYFDVFPLLLLTQASLETMQAKAAASRFDVRRFRPNLLIGGTESSVEFPELDWRGKRLAVGDCVIEVTVECPRCVMVTHGFDDLDKDPKVMRSLVKEAGGCLGVYAKVEQEGLVRAGDEIRLLN